MQDSFKVKQNQPKQKCLRPQCWPKTWCSGRGRMLLPEQWNLFNVNKALTGQACQALESLVAFDNASIIYKRSTHIMKPLSRLDLGTSSRAHKIDASPFQSC